MTDALVSGLNFSKGKGDSEVAWIDAMITARDQVCRDAVTDNQTDDTIDQSDKILTLEPLPLNEVRFHKKRNSSTVLNIDTCNIIFCRFPGIKRHL